MAQLPRQIGTTSQILPVFIRDSASTTGAGKTGILFNASGFTCYYKRSSGTASAAVTLATIATLGTYTSGGWKEIDATNQPGLYEFHPPNAAVASGAEWVVFYFQGAAGMVPQPLLLDLTATSNQDSVRGGMTALPNAAAAASGGLPTVDSTNSVKIQIPFKRNTAVSNFPFTMIDSTGTPKTGLTVTSQRSIDGGAFASTTNSATEVGNGDYVINLAAADTNGTNSIVLRFSASGALDNLVTILLQP